LQSSAGVYNDACLFGPYLSVLALSRDAPIGDRKKMALIGRGLGGLRENPLLEMFIWGVSLAIAAVREALAQPGCTG